jgi:hypothetical protein
MTQTRKPTVSGKAVKFNEDTKFASKPQPSKLKMLTPKPVAPAKARQSHSRTSTDSIDNVDKPTADDDAGSVESVQGFDESFVEPPQPLQSHKRPRPDEESKDEDQEAGTGRCYEADVQ